MVKGLTWHEILALTMDLKRYIGLQVKAARLEHGWTQEQLAERVEKAVETISNIERGHAQTGLETLGRLSQVLNVSLRDFFEGTDRALALSQPRCKLELELGKLATELSDKEINVMIDLGKSLKNNRKSR